jgi:hypothetical protein
MKLRPVSDELFAYVMRDIAGTRFERFTKQVFAGVFGEAFVPLGGIHDGGADGAISSFIQEVQGKSNTFAQFSATDGERARGKIKSTIDALRKVGREPKQVIYATSETLPKADLMVSALFEAEGVLVSVRDYERMKNYVNTELPANQAFYSEFAADIGSLVRAASNRLPVVSEFAKDPTVYVFLNHELRDRFSRDHLNNRVLDALIYWALRETDPDKGLRLERSQIASGIQAAFPTAKSVLLPNLDARLQELSKKDSAGLERLRYYGADDSFCLPFSMRSTLAEEAASADGDQRGFRASIADRLREEAKGAIDDKLAPICESLVFGTIHRYFIDQGVVLAAFFEGRLEQIHIVDQIVEDTMVKALSEIDDARSVSPEMMGHCLSVLRGIFYRTTERERQYMTYLSRTSCLLVTLQSAPRLLEYFNQMAGNFRFLVGSDMLVKATSEQYLEQPHQQVTNLLLACKRLGAELILTEPVLEEVFTHIRASDLEFENHYLRQEPYLKAEHISDCDRILIRAYFHAKGAERGPSTWKAYINGMTDPDGLRNRSEAARHALRGLFVQRFGMLYMSSDELGKTVVASRVKELAERLEQSRPDRRQEISYNDALMVHATFAQRHLKKEVGIYDGFGYRTWWLTKETRILSMTGELVRSEGGIPYIMRPEFMLNFIALAPKAADVRKAFEGFLPTTAGLQLGQYLGAGAMHAMLDDVDRWKELSPERVAMILSEKANKLQHDRFKRYVQNIH